MRDCRCAVPANTIYCGFRTLLSECFIYSVALKFPNHISLFVSSLPTLCKRLFFPSEIRDRHCGLDRPAAQTDAKTNMHVGDGLNELLYLTFKLPTA